MLLFSALRLCPTTATPSSIASELASIGFHFPFLFLLSLLSCKLLQALASRAHMDSTLTSPTPLLSPATAALRLRPTTVAPSSVASRAHQHWVRLPLPLSPLPPLPQAPLSSRGESTRQELSSCLRRALTFRLLLPLLLPGKLTSAGFHPIISSDFCSPSLLPLHLLSCKLPRALASSSPLLWRGEDAGGRQHRKDIGEEGKVAYVISCVLRKTVK